MDKVPLAKARQALEEQKMQLANEYIALEQKQKTNEGSEKDISLISKITIEHMFAITRQQQQFVEKILKALEGQTE